MKWFIGIGVFILPTLLASTIFHFLLTLKGIELQIVIGITILILLNIALFIINTLESRKTKLLIDLNAIRILDHSNSMQVIPFEKIKIINISSNNNEKTTRQAIQMLTETFHGIIIQKDNLDGIRYTMKKETNQKLFTISTQEDWFRLLQALNQNI